ncbi:MAG TPA: extracellular solute-binding protein [Firmicutes bacterium]|nr:extracellular solute-binding protein [Bacillota bacterium]
MVGWVQIKPVLTLFDTHAGVSGLIYNQELFDRAGLLYPNENWNYDDLMSAARKLTVRNSSGETVQWGMNAPFQRSPLLTVMHSFGGNWIDSTGTKSLLASPGSIAGIKWVSDLMNTYHASALKVPGLLTEKTAIQMIGPWALRNFIAREDIRFAVEVVPAGPAGRIPGASNISGLAITVQSKYPDKAWAFICTVQRALLVA